MEVADYLKRIRFEGNVNPDLSTLKKLHSLHMHNIPFENLDIHYGKPIVLDPVSLKNKIITNRKGGYCYELNGLFFALLTELGFKVSLISARVNSGIEAWGKEFDHMAIVVDLGDLYLADVGFGDSFSEPLKIEPETIQRISNKWYKILKHENDYFRLMKSEDGIEFTDEYLFSLKQRDVNKFEEMNKYHQTSPDSHFTKNKICSMATDNGRVTLSNTKLIITEGGNKSSLDIADEADFQNKLKEYFDIRIE